MPNVSSPLRPDWAMISQEEFRNRYRQLSSLQNLAEFLGIAPSQLSFYSSRRGKERSYTTFLIPRRNGGERQIEAPTRTLKYIQRLIHESLTRIYGPHPAVHGFRPKKSIVTNAKNHLGCQYILNIDLKDFFPSITYPRIRGRLVAPPYSLHEDVAHLIAELATNSHGQLPQGSPSSPVIANIMAAGLDDELIRLSRSFRCRYTRYADDITISTSRREMPPQIARFPNASGTGQVILGDELIDSIERHGFQINNEKSRLQSYWTRQMCTGLVVNNNRVSPPRPYIRRLRALIYHWWKNGWQDAAQTLHSKENRPLFKNREAFENHVIGRIGYLKMVRGQDDKTALRFEQIIALLPPGH